jgi:rhamnosyltransferase
MNVDSVRIDAVVVLHDPSPDVLDTIRSIAHQVGMVYALDNSEPPASEFAAVLSSITNLAYLSQGENLGVARALNIGAEKAIAGGCDFLLTMDQDSLAAPDLVERMTACLAHTGRENIGMIAPYHLTKANGPSGANAEFEAVMTPMTSGCLLNLSAYGKVGPFREDLFIDFVDNEYCLRLRRAGFRVLRANRAVLRHDVGNIRKYGPFIATNHSPLRRYYKTRNRFLVNKLYRRDFPGHCLFDRVRLLKEIVSIILFEREKGAKLRMMWRGFLDYRRGRFGRLDEGVKTCG